MIVCMTLKYMFFNMLLNLSGVGRFCSLQTGAGNLPRRDCNAGNAAGDADGALFHPKLEIYNIGRLRITLSKIHCKFLFLTEEEKWLIKISTHAD